MVKKAGSGKDSRRSQGQETKGKDNEGNARIGREQKIRCDARSGRKDKGGLVKGRKEVRKSGKKGWGEQGRRKKSYGEMD
jgi:hypothetical protein